MANKIYQGDITNVSSKEFGEVKIGDETLQGSDVKKAVADMAKGGVSQDELEKKLKQAGVSGSQIKKRQQIVKAVSGDDNTKEERPVVPKHLRALDRSREDEIRPQRKFQTVGS
ncbi:MAG: hypothetical protein ABIH48_00610, partial [Candidatus Falkowbacteria bacterium]